MIPDAVMEAVRKHKYPLLFATVSGAHLYGFASADSDWDLRGAHILPAEQVLGLNELEETTELNENSDIELDLVTHDVRKFFTLLLRPNGYVLEQLYSPIVVHTTPEHAELKRIAQGCITRFHVYHYLGFAANQWKLFQKESPRRVKPLLYVFRVLLTGIHLMTTGEVEPNLLILNDTFKLPFLEDLIARKITGTEHECLEQEQSDLYEARFLELEAQLKQAGEGTSLPPGPTAKAALHSLLVDLRLQSIPELSGLRAARRKLGDDLR